MDEIITFGDLEEIIGNWVYKFMNDIRGIKLDLG